MIKVISVWKDFLNPTRMDPVFCIPTYNRQGTIVRKTLKVLKEQSIPVDWIHLYVSDEDQKAIYESTIPPELYGHIHIAAPGLAAARNCILESWPLGKWIVMLDDDITDICTIDASGSLVRADLLKVAIHAFETAKDIGCCLWGVYPVCNGFFMKHLITSDLRFCVGPCFGMINPGTDEGGIRLPFSEKEDYVRTLMAYERDGAVIRLNNVAVKTKYYKEPGGMQCADRLALQKEAVGYILERWPDRTAIDTRKKKSGYPEILIKKIHTEKTQIRAAPDFTGR